MEFSITRNCERGRCGLISNTGRLPNTQIRTPSVFLYSQGGGMPFIAPEFVQDMDLSNFIIQLPFGRVITLAQLTDEEYTIAHFIGFDSSLICLTPLDPVSQMTASASRAVNEIESTIGDISLNVNRYLFAAHLLVPDIYTLLGDGNTNSGSNQARINESVANTKRCFDETMASLQSSAEIKTPSIIAPIVGGYDIDARRTSVLYYLNSEHADKIKGFCYEGFFNSCMEMEFDTLEHILPIITEINIMLPKNALRCCFGGWSPLAAINLVIAGIDVLDASYAYICAHRQSALVFDFSMTQPNITGMFEINLNDTRYATDLRPLMPNCLCRTCITMPRSGIHRLIVNQASLGTTYIMVHNLFHYTEFFKKIEQCVFIDIITELRDWVKIQYDGYIASRAQFIHIEEAPPSSDEELDIINVPQAAVNDGGGDMPSSDDEIDNINVPQGAINDGGGDMPSSEEDIDIMNVPHEANIDGGGDM